MPRRALLIFADNTRLDLARRRLPMAALPLLRSPEFQGPQAGHADVHVFGARTKTQRNGQHFHPQRGRDFAERFEDAIATLAALGYDEVVAVGRDCPALSADDITRAFADLEDHRLVLGPDHRGGCYLIAFRIEDRALLRGIRWKQNTDCAQLCERAGAAAVLLLSIKYDIDSWADLELVARVDYRIGRIVAFLLQAIAATAREVTAPCHAATRFVRLHGQIPPPAFA